MTHRVRELSGFFKDFRGTCLTRRLMALSRPAPDTLDAGSMSMRWRNMERNSREGSAIHTTAFSISYLWPKKTPEISRSTTIMTADVSHVLLQQYPTCIIANSLKFADWRNYEKKKNHYITMHTGILDSNWLICSEIFLDLHSYARFSYHYFLL